MNKKSVGLLLGAATGLTLAWVFRNRIGWFDKTAKIVVDIGSDGNPHVVFVTDEVEVKKDKHVRWNVINDSEVDVLVALADWEDEDHDPVSPAVSADPDDDDEPPQHGLTRKVPAEKKRPIRGKARGPNTGKVERVKYAVHLDGHLEVDPIVKLTL